jgi:hypothetical protein
MTKLVTLIQYSNSDKLPKQAKAILDTLAKLGGKADRKKLIQQLGTKLVSKQDPSRVYAFYRANLIKQGYIQEEKVTATATETATEANADADEEAAVTTTETGGVETTVESSAELSASIKVGDELVKFNVMRGFKQSDGAVVIICGSDYDDHQLWKVSSNNSAVLLGVLKREHYRKVLRSKTVNLSADEFDFVNKADALPVTGKTMLASDLASELDCEFVAELEECS